MFEERVLLGNGFLIEILFSGGNFHLFCRKESDLLVEYQGDGKTNLRTLRGRASAYEFKSVEKLRYDFERDVERALRQG